MNGIGILDECHDDRKHEEVMTCKIFTIRCFVFQRNGRVTYSVDTASLETTMRKIPSPLADPARCKDLIYYVDIAGIISKHRQCASLPKSSAALLRRSPRFRISRLMPLPGKSVPTWLRRTSGPPSCSRGCPYSSKRAGRSSVTSEVAGDGARS